MTKGQINRIGQNLLKAIQEQKSPSEEDLLGLQQYRKEFKEPLKNASNELLRIMQNIDNEGIVTYRVKRIESILSKIERQPDMDLARVNDIAGCRCILQNEKKVFQFLNELRNSQVLQIVQKTDTNGNQKEYLFDYINQILFLFLYNNISIILQSFTRSNSIIEFIIISRIYYRISSQKRIIRINIKIRI